MSFYQLNTYQKKSKIMPIKSLMCVKCVKSSYNMKTDKLA